MTQYLIAFADEWVPDHTPEQLRAKARASRVVLDEMTEQGVLVWTNGGIDASTAICSVEPVDGEAVVTPGPRGQTPEHLGGACVVEVADDEEATRWATRLTLALDWPQEVHRFPGPGVGL